MGEMACENAASPKQQDQESIGHILHSIHEWKWYKNVFWKKYNKDVMCRTVDIESTWNCKI